jgi:hypothetical protein
MPSNSMPPVKIRVAIMIDVDAEDYLAAAEHQAKIQRHLDRIRDEYPLANLAVSQRRRVTQRIPRRHGPLHNVGVPTGNLNRYDQ